MTSNRRSRGTIDIVYRIDPSRRVGRKVPRTPLEARNRLVHGNGAFAQLLEARRRGGSVRVIPLDPGELGHGAEAGGAPAQEPFAAVLGCSDARVPVEMIFQQRSNDLFVVRVAGNGVGSGCLGSLRYAAAHFTRSLRLVVVLGHSHCGAVTAAVDAFLKPRTYLPLAANYPLRAIVDAILVAVRSASLGLESVHGPRVVERPGYRTALVEATVVLNAALSAFALKQELETTRCRVVFGSYDLVSRAVRLPTAPAGAAARSEIGLFPAPGREADFRRLTARVAASAKIAALLE
jgi:carbonic anhydrase